MRNSPGHRLGRANGARVSTHIASLQVEDRRHVDTNAQLPDVVEVPRSRAFHAFQQHRLAQFDIRPLSSAARRRAGKETSRFLHRCSAQLQLSRQLLGRICLGKWPQVGLRDLRMIVRLQKIDSHRPRSVLVAYGHEARPPLVPMHLCQHKQL